MRTTEEPERKIEMFLSDLAVKGNETGRILWSGAVVLQMLNRDST
jgi:hypothetical protein